MTSYATLPEFVEQLDATSHKPEDDAWIENLLARCSREFDGDTGYWFYGDVRARTYDVPACRTLKLDAPLLAVARLTNGDDTHIPASEYHLWPYNGLHKTEIRLKQTTAYQWLSSSAGETENAVTVLGTWGYVDRDATDPESLAVISNSKAAVLYLATAVYRKRYGRGVEAAATVTGAGVVITPRDKSKEYWSLVSLYRNLL